MKKFALIAALALLGASLFAQAPGGRGPGFGPDMEWKLGMVVTTEYKKVAGTLVLGESLEPKFKANGVVYEIRLPRLAELTALKNGDAITIEGTFTTVKSDTAVPAVARAFKITVNGKEIDLAALRDERRGGDQGPDSKGPKK